MYVIPLILIVLLPLAFFCFDYFRNKKIPSIKNFRQVATLTLCIYILYLGTVDLISMGYKNDLYKFDLDKNYSFDIEETSLRGYKEASDNFTQDTGRTFAPIVGAPLAFIWVIINYGIFYLIMLVRKFISFFTKKAL